MNKSIFIILLLIFAFCTEGRAEALTLSDIKEAILEDDYQKVKDLAEEFPEHNFSDQEQDEALYYFALSELYLGDLAKSRGDFQKLVDRTENKDLYDQASVGVISTYYLENEYREALKRANRLLEERSDSNFLSLIYLKIARINLKLSHWDPARRFLRKILKEFPDSLEAYTAKQLLEEEKYFTVQVGAFLDKKHALSLVDDLRKKGQYGYIVETEGKDEKIFYRVRVGELSSLNAAEGLKKKLAQMGYPAIVYP